MGAQEEATAPQEGKVVHLDIKPSAVLKEMLLRLNWSKISKHNILKGRL